jgi:hyaluronoglucosaminidase
MPPAEAAAQFEAAALNWFVSTLEVCKSLRPRARWGYYGFPTNPYVPCVAQNGPLPECGYRNPTAGPVYQADNDAIQQLWAASTALFPSLYIPSMCNQSSYSDTNADYLAGVTEEAVRLATNYGSPDIVVRPFIWSYYHDVDILLSPTDMHNALALPLSVGADGVVVWGSPSSSQDAEMMAYLDNTLGPFTQSVVTCACAGNSPC